MVVKIPPQVQEEILFKQAVGLIEIKISENSKVAIDAQNGLSRIDFPGDFELDNGFYTNPGSNPENADLVIVVEQAVGLITIQYSK
jgi:hypothetical protein